MPRRCGRCSKTKPASEFIRHRVDGPPVKTCNDCRARKSEADGRNKARRAAKAKQERVKADEEPENPTGEACTDNQIDEEPEHEVEQGSYEFLDYDPDDFTTQAAISDQTDGESEDDAEPLTPEVDANHGNPRSKANTSDQDNSGIKVAAGLDTSEPADEAQVNEVPG